MQVSALQSQNKAKQYKSDEILIKQYTFLQLRMGLCVLKCVKSGTLWTVAGQLWQANCGTFP